MESIDNIKAFDKFIELMTPDDKCIERYGN